MATDPHDTVTAPMQHLAAGPLMRSVAVALIVPSMQNPRKWFDLLKLQELADSIKATGVHQPILLRPLPGSRAHETAQNRTPGAPLPEYELICGERRWRACQLAGQTEVPAMIRPMDDAQALEAQIIENLQREDVTELEEAEAYRALMDHQEINAEQVGAKIGKSRAYVYARLKVLDLCEHGQQLMREGKLDFSQALPIARIPNEQLQLDAVKKATSSYYANEGGMSARQVQEMVKREYMLHLDRAPFDRNNAELCPTAGACTECPNRTGANPDLFADVDSPDVCTNPPCYHAKESAHASQLRKHAAERGCEIVDEKQSKKLIGNYYSEHAGIPGYKRLDSPHDSPVKGKTLRKLIGKMVLEKSGIKTTMVTNPQDGNQLIECVTPEQAEQLLQMAGKAEAEEQMAADRAKQAERDEKTAEDDAKKAYESAWRMEVLQRVVTTLGQANADFVSSDASPEAWSRAEHCASTIGRLVAERLADQINTDDAKLLCKLLGYGKVAPKDEIKAAARDLFDTPIMLVGCILALHDRAHHQWYDSQHPEQQPNRVLTALAEVCVVDIDQCKAQAQANMRAAAAEKAPIPVKSEAKLVDPPQPPAARAGGVRGNSKAKSGKDNVRGAGVAKVTTPEEAMAQIAAALREFPPAETDTPAAQATEGENQGQEPTNTAAPAGAEEPDLGADAPGNEPRPNGTPLAVGGWATIDASYPVPAHRGLLVRLESCVNDAWIVRSLAGDSVPGGVFTKYLTPADSPAKTTVEDGQEVRHGLALGAAVFVNSTPKANQQKAWIGYAGTVDSYTGDRGLTVAFKLKDKTELVTFDHTEIEVQA